MRHEEIKEFHVRAYGRQELAQAYAPELTPTAAWRRLRRWMEINPRLRPLLGKPGNAAFSRVFTPSEVTQIVAELGEP